MIRGLALLVASLTMASSTHAKLTLEEILNEMKGRQAQIQDSTFRFIMHARKGQFQGKTTGQIYLKKPNHLKVLQATPQQQTILTDGDQLWLYTPKQNQVVIGSWKRWVQTARFPLPLMDFIGLFGPENRLDQYQAYYEGHENNEYKLRFVNRVPDAAPPVVLWISDETFLPVQGFVYYMGSPVQVRLRDIKTNVGLSDAQFKPAFPDTTEQIPFSF